MNKLCVFITETLDCHVIIPCKSLSFHTSHCFQPVFPICISSSPSPVLSVISAFNFMRNWEHFFINKQPRTTHSLAGISKAHVPIGYTYMRASMRSRLCKRHHFPINHCGGWWHQGQVMRLPVWGWLGDGWGLPPEVAGLGLAGRWVAWAVWLVVGVLCCDGVPDVRGGWEYSRSWSWAPMPVVGLPSYCAGYLLSLPPASCHPPYSSQISKGGLPKDSVFGLGLFPLMLSPV